MNQAVDFNNARLITNTGRKGNGKSLFNSMRIIVYYTSRKIDIQIPVVSGVASRRACSWQRDSDRSVNTIFPFALIYETRFSDMLSFTQDEDRL